MARELYATGPNEGIVRVVDRNGNAVRLKSLPGFITTKLGLGAVGSVTGYVLAAVLVGVTCWLVRRVWLGQLDWIVGAGWATFAMLACAGSLMPWYVAWLLPLAAIGRDRRLLKATTWMTGFVLFLALLGYIPQGGSLGL